MRDRFVGHLLKWVVGCCIGLVFCDYGFLGAPTHVLDLFDGRV